MRIKPPQCAGDRLSVSTSTSAGPSSFRASFVLSAIKPQKALEVGVSVPVDAIPALYKVSIDCQSQDIVFALATGTVTVTNAKVAPVVTAISGTQITTPTWRVEFVGSGCHSGGLSANRAKVYIGTRHGYGMKWREHVVEVTANGSYSLVVNVAHDPIVGDEPADRPYDWYVDSYCIEPDGLIVGTAATIIPIDSPEPEPPTTTTNTPTLPLTA